MPARFEIDKEKRLVRSEVWGEVTFADIRNHQDALLAHPEFNPEFDQLYDATGVTSTEVTAGQVQSMALKTVFSSTSRRAFVAPEPSIYGMIRIYETHYSMLDSPANLRVFRDKSSALQWLQRER